MAIVQVGSEHHLITAMPVLKQKTIILIQYLIDLTTFLTHSSLVLFYMQAATYFSFFFLKYLYWLI